METTAHPAPGRRWPAGPPPRSTPEQLAALQARLTGTPPPAAGITNAAFLAELVRGHPGRPWVTAFAEDPHKAPASAWRGKVAKSREAVPGGEGNAYFATATFAETATTRTKEGTLSVLAVVLDDIGTDNLDDLPGPSWVTETSPHNHQAGYALAPGEDPGEVAALLSALTGAGRKVADRSGNSIARYVRLPCGVNSKAAVVEDVGCPFPVRLARWEPAKRYKVEALADAFGVTPTRPQERTRDPDTDAELREAIVSCAAFHDPLVKLAARLVGRGMEAGEVKAVLSGLMTAAAGNLSTDARRRDWETRLAEIPRYVATAAAKFRDPRAAPPGAGRIWTGTEGQGRPPEDGPRYPLIWLADAAPRIATAGLVRGLITPGAMIVTYGESNSGKTFHVLDRDLCIAAGRTWYGRETTAGFVLYVAAEGAHSVENRVAAYRDAFLPEHQSVPFAILPRPLDLLRPEADVAPLIDFIKATEDRLGVACVKATADTLARVLAGGNENAPDDMGNVVRRADEIRTACGCTFEFVHHAGKDTAKGARGHSSLRAATDTEIEVTAKEGLYVARVTKQRDLQGGDEFAFTLRVVELGQDPYGHPVTTCVPEWAKGGTPGRERARLTKAEHAVLATMKELMSRDRKLPPVACFGALHPPKTGQIACPVPLLREEVIHKGGVGTGDKRDTQRHAFRRALHGLRDRAVIGIFDDWAWLRDTRDTAGHL